MRITKKSIDEGIFEKGKDYPMWLIDWVDIHTIGDGWQHIEDVDLSFPHIKSVGFIMDETDEKIFLVQTIASDEEIIGGIVIPKTVITGKHRLRYGNKKKK